MTRSGRIPRRDLGRDRSARKWHPENLRKDVNITFVLQWVLKMFLSSFNKVRFWENHQGIDWIDEWDNWMAPKTRLYQLPRLASWVCATVGSLAKPSCHVLKHGYGEQIQVLIRTSPTNGCFFQFYMFDCPRDQQLRRYPRLELHQAPVASFCGGNASASHDHDRAADPVQMLRLMTKTLWKMDNCKRWKIFDTEWAQKLTWRITVNHSIAKKRYTVQVW